MESEIQQLKLEQFPPLVSEISDPPQSLYYEGTIPKWSKYKFLAVVGSRRFSNYGKEICEKLIAGLKDYNIIIVSGLALGIDSIAHRAALVSGLKTISIPGSGLDRKVLHPHSHCNLADEIVSSGGLMLSEYEPLMPAAQWTFAQRNRIMAGMCHATLLIEAEERSGTLITARLATDYDREVLVVPHDITRATSKGVHQFLKLGATPVTESGDILRALNILEMAPAQAEPARELSEKEQKVFDILSRDKLSKEELVEKLEMQITETNILLSAMELKGLIVEELGKIRIK